MDPAGLSFLRFHVLALSMIETEVFLQMLVLTISERTPLPQTCEGRSPRVGKG
jgi:hypothetical protein